MCVCVFAPDEICLARFDALPGAANFHVIITRKLFYYIGSRHTGVRERWCSLCSFLFLPGSSNVCRILTELFWDYTAASLVEFSWVYFFWTVDYLPRRTLRVSVAILDLLSDVHAWSSTSETDSNLVYSFVDSKTIYITTHTSHTCIIHWGIDTDFVCVCDSSLFSLLGKQTSLPYCLCNLHGILRGALHIGWDAWWRPSQASTD